VCPNSSDRTVESDDLSLVREFQQGSERAFNELVLRHRRGIFLLVVGMISNPDDAEDITQEVFIKAYGSLGDFRGESAFYTWIYRITVNLCLNYLRGRRVRSFFGLEKIAATMPASHSADEPTEVHELSVYARKAIAELPEKQRAVFILRHFRELPHAEIAEIMNRDVGTIKANYFLAVQKLRQKLGPYVMGEANPPQNKTQKSKSK
jgi:RNA polymerase sigma-70 factor, ECF subfamily